MAQGKQPGPGGGPSGSRGPWQDRVRFGPGVGFAYRPGEVLVRSDFTDLARRQLGRPDDDGTAVLGGAFVRFSDVRNPLEALAALNQAGIPAQPNHVLFAASHHPRRPAGFTANPFTANPFTANPFTANPFTANPFTANPFTANPFTANMGVGCGCRCGASCGCGCGDHGGGCPPANPFPAIYLDADPSPFASPWAQSTGRRRSSARPSEPPTEAPSEPGGNTTVHIAILDTGWAESHPPDDMMDPEPSITPHGGDRPDEDGDRFLDPAAGHGTFIAGVIEQVAPGCELELIEVLTTYGDGDEVVIGELLLALAGREDQPTPDFVNLSFGGYSPIGMWGLAHAVAVLRARGTVIVASAGNDATCVPMYPAALAQVIGVAALDRSGNAAPFTNYGPWVDACALGVDIVSLFFKGFNGEEPPHPSGRDDDAFEGWAIWSGTSFAAPRVVAELARLAQTGTDPDDAVEQLIRRPGRERLPMLGTVV